jgi:peptidoglycan hydrolase CwlO-like protein
VNPDKTWSDVQIIDKNFKKNMEIENIDGRIAVKRKEVQVERDPNRKRVMQNDLEILQLRKQIETLKNKIEVKQQYK